MQGLMLKLLNVDADGERALRVVAYFDELLAHRPDLESVVRATAILADCRAGLQVPGLARTLCFLPSGDAAPTGGDSAVTRSVEIVADDTGERRGLAWLERDGPDGDFDEFILERMALVVGAVVERRRSTRPGDTPTGFADPALAALLVNDRSSEIDRTRAARLMGIAPHARLQTVAVQTSEDTSDLGSLRKALVRAAGRPLALVQLTADTALGVLPLEGGGVEWADPMVAEAVALGPVTEVVQAPASWRAARDTLRFAGIGPSWPRFLRHDRIGGLGLLLELDREEVLGDEDVLAMQRLADGPNGEDTIAVLDRFLHADSLRSAARDANFHHSSLQARVQRLEELLGMDLRRGVDRQRATQALLLWQLFVGSRGRAAGMTIGSPAR